MINTSVSTERSGLFVFLLCLNPLLFWTTVFLVGYTFEQSGV